MQPPAAQKPVVDVLAPKRPAAVLSARPSVPLTVREAPAREATPHIQNHAPATQTSAPKPQDQTDVTQSHVPPEDETTTLQPGPQKSNHSNTPVGAITAAILVMIVLSALTVAIYLKG